MTYNNVQALWVSINISMKFVLFSLLSFPRLISLPRSPYERIIDVNYLMCIIFFLNHGSLRLVRACIFSEQLLYQIKQKKGV